MACVVHTFALNFALGIYTGAFVKTKICCLRQNGKSGHKGKFLQCTWLSIHTLKAYSKMIKTFTNGIFRYFHSFSVDDMSASRLREVKRGKRASTREICLPPGDMTLHELELLVVVLCGTTRSVTGFPFAINNVKRKLCLVFS